MGMGNISLKNVDTINKIKNVAEHLAHAKHPTTSSTMALGNVPMQSTIFRIIFPSISHTLDVHLT